MNAATTNPVPETTIFLTESTGQDTREALNNDECYGQPQGLVAVLNRILPGATARLWTVQQPPSTGRCDTGCRRNLAPPFLPRLGEYRPRTGRGALPLVAIRPGSPLRQPPYGRLPPPPKASIHGFSEPQRCFGFSPTVEVGEMAVRPEGATGRIAWSSPLCGFAAPIAASTPGESASPPLRGGDEELSTLSPFS
jgi:hypothetical protein